jgi:hypothetical protein
MKFKHVKDGYYVRNYGSEYVSDAVACIIIFSVMVALGFMTLAIMG